MTDRIDNIVWDVIVARGKPIVPGTAWPFAFGGLFHRNGVALFLLTPYSKMAHGAYRFAALIRDARGKRRQDPLGGERRE